MQSSSLLHAAAAAALIVLLTGSAGAADPPQKIPANSKVFVNEMNGFGPFVVAAINKKKVPLVVVLDKTKADYEITGASESQKSGWAKTIFLGQTGSREEASINVVDLKDSTIVFAYNVNKGNSARGRQSSAEACAKHLKEAMKD